MWVPSFPGRPARLAGPLMSTRRGALIGAGAGQESVDIRPRMEIRRDHSSPTTDRLSDYRVAARVFVTRTSDAKGSNG
jgi:hypothetical protein